MIPVKLKTFWQNLKCNVHFKKKPQPEINYYDKKILIAARNYAMMVSMGSYIEKNSAGNCIYNVGHNEREKYAEMFLSNLKFAAKDSLVEDSMSSHPEVKFYG